MLVRHTGPVPPELGNLAELKKLFLGENQLNGKHDAQVWRYCGFRKIL